MAAGWDEKAGATLWPTGPDPLGSRTSEDWERIEDTTLGSSHQWARMLSALRRLRQHRFMNSSFPLIEPIA